MQNLVGQVSGQVGGVQQLATGGCQDLAKQGGVQQLAAGGVQNLAGQVSGQVGGAQQLAAGGVQQLATGGVQQLAAGGVQQLTGGQLGGLQSLDQVQDLTGGLGAFQGFARQFGGSAGAAALGAGAAAFAGQGPGMQVPPMGLTSDLGASAKSADLGGINLGGINLPNMVPDDFMKMGGGVFDAFQGSGEATNILSALSGATGSLSTMASNLAGGVFGGTQSAEAPENTGSAASELVKMAKAAKEQLDSLKVATMQEMVQEITYPVGDTKATCKFLYLTNTQASTLGSKQMPRVREALGLRDPSMVIRLMPSRFGEAYYWCIYIYIYIYIYVISLSLSLALSLSLSLSTLNECLLLVRSLLLLLPLSLL